MHVLKAGIALKLIREHNNSHDPNAIRVELSPVNVTRGGAGGGKVSLHTHAFAAPDKIKVLLMRKRAWERASGRVERQERSGSLSEGACMRASAGG